MYLNSQAIDAHSRVVILDENFKEGWVNMGQAWKELGNYEKAEQLFQKVRISNSKFIGRLFR